MYEFCHLCLETYKQAPMNCKVFAQFCAFVRIKKGARLSPKPFAIPEISASELNLELFLELAVVVFLAPAMTGF